MPAALALNPSVVAPAIFAVLPWPTPVDSVPLDWADSPILYIGSHQPVSLTEVDYTKLKQYVDAGGMLFTHADGASASFTDFVESSLAAKLFPQYKFVDVAVNDPIYTVQYPFKVTAAEPNTPFTRRNSVLLLMLGVMPAFETL